MWFVTNNIVSHSIDSELVSRDRAHFGQHQEFDLILGADQKERGLCAENGNVYKHVIGVLRLRSTD